MRPRNPYYSGPVSDHFDGHRFLNPAGEPETDRSLGQIWRWRRNLPDHRWPASVPVIPAKPMDSVDGLRFTMVGHATVLIQIAGLNILTDPVWSPRASPLHFAGPLRVTKPGVKLSDLPRIDAVLLSHNHYDHLDMATLRHLHRKDAPLIITPLGNDRIIHRSIPDARIVALDWGESTPVAPGVEAHVVPALHWSSRGMRDRRMALWGGFMLKSADRLIYFAGDTGYGTGDIFRRLREAYGPVDVALLPIGAYDPRWFMAAQHTNPAEAIAIMQHLDARLALGIHWGTFQLTDEPREDPLHQLAQGLARHSIHPERFPALHPGQVIEV